MRISALLVMSAFLSSSANCDDNFFRATLKPAQGGSVPDLGEGRAIDVEAGGHKASANGPSDDTCPPPTMGDPKAFFSSWTADQREAWIASFGRCYDAQIEASAGSVGVPPKLLKLILLNEMVDFGDLEKAAEDLGLGGSVGLGQIRPSTVKRDLGPTSKKIAAMSEDEISRMLSHPGLNIRTSALLLREYLATMCAAQRQATLSEEFVKVFGLYRCQREPFYCESVKTVTDRCVVVSAVAVWNAGPKIITATDLDKSENTKRHANNGLNLWGYVK